MTSEYCKYVEYHRQYIFSLFLKVTEQILFYSICSRAVVASLIEMKFTVKHVLDGCISEINSAMLLAMYINHDILS